MVDFEALVFDFVCEELGRGGFEVTTCGGELSAPVRALYEGRSLDELSGVEDSLVLDVKVVSECDEVLTPEVIASDSALPRFMQAEGNMLEREESEGVFFKCCGPEPEK